MPQVETLKGPVDTTELGFTLMHEHVFVHSEGVAQNFPSVWDEASETAAARKKLQDMADAGVRTIVDLTVLGLERNIPRLRDIVADLPLTVIVATGLYTYNEVPNYFNFRDEDAMADLFVSDITDGIQDTTIKAAILKCATRKCCAPSLVPTAVPACRSRRTRTSARSAASISSASLRRKASTSAASSSATAATPKTSTISHR